MHTQLWIDFHSFKNEFPFRFLACYGAPMGQEGDSEEITLSEPDDRSGGMPREQNTAIKTCEKIGRMDFAWRVLSRDEEKGTAQVALVPDPRRYEVEEIGGHVYFRDRFLANVFPAEMLEATLHQQLANTPIYKHSPTIDSAPNYARARFKAISTEIDTNCFIAPKEQASPNKKLEYSDGPSGVAFLSVDICSASTKRLRDRNAFERAYAIFLNELVTLVGQFGGSVNKTTGDGFIAFIDLPSFTLRCDTTVDLGLSILTVMRDAVNPALGQAGLGSLHIRVGADHGPAEIRQHVVPTTGFCTTEIASDALNRAVKIEQSCDEDEFRIGRNLYELIHVGWLERAVEVPFDGQCVGVAGYQTYRVT